MKKNYIFKHYPPLPLPPPPPPFLWPRDVCLKLSYLQPPLWKNPGSAPEWLVPRKTVHFVSRETLRFEENKINYFPRDQSLSDLLYSWKVWNWKFTKPCCNGGRRSTFAGNSALLLSDVIVFAMLPAQSTFLILSASFSSTGCCFPSGVTLIIVAF